MSNKIKLAASVRRGKPCNCKPHFISSVKLAQELRISDATVRVWVYRGLLPQPARVGNSLIWSVGELEEWYATRRQAPWRRRTAEKIFNKPAPIGAAA
jgi:predicted DNA-binding transcriptional regulator AlpA